VFDAAFSPDGHRLATVGQDPVVRVWSANTGKELYEFLGHEGSVFHIAYFSGHRLVSQGAAGYVKVWDETTSHEPLVRADVHCFSADDKRVATGVFNRRQTEIWDLPDGRKTAEIEGTSPAFTPDGRRLATLVEGQGVKLWDTVAGQEVLSLPGLSPSAYQATLSFSPNGRWLAGVGQFLLLGASAGGLLGLFEEPAGMVVDAFHGSPSQFCMWDAGAPIQLSALTRGERREVLLRRQLAQVDPAQSDSSQTAARQRSATVFKWHYDGPLRLLGVDMFRRLEREGLR
jgi:WD40 repeat protein